MNHFEKAFSETMNIEKGYVNVSTDRGGETLFGISRKFNPSWEAWNKVDILKAKYPKDLKNFLNTDTELYLLARAYYQKNYFSSPYIDINIIKDESIAIELFDTAVNMHPKTAAKFLQRALNLLNRNERKFKDLKPDGRVGPVTLNAYRKVNPNNLLKVLNGLQFMRYVKIVEKDPTQEINFAGWMKRV